MKYTVQFLLTGFTAILFSACTTPSPVSPEITTSQITQPVTTTAEAVLSDQSKSVNNNRETLQALSTETPDVIGSTSSSPLSFPTATSVMEPPKVITSPAVQPTATTTVNTPEATPTTMEKTPVPTSTPFPLISPVPLERYYLSEPATLPIQQGKNNEQTVIYLGWTSNSRQLVGYTINQETQQTKSFVKFSTKIDVTLSTTPEILFDASGMQLQYENNFPVPSVQLLGQRDLLLIREQLGENLFSFAITDFSGVKQVEIGPATSPIYAISPDGWLAYLNENQLVVIDPEQADKTRKIIFPDQYGFKVDAELFSFSLSPNGKLIALYAPADSLQTGQFKIIDTTKGEAITVEPSPNYAVAYSQWSPDGQMLAFIEASYYKPAYEGAIGEFREPHLAIIQSDGQNKWVVNYRDSEKNAMTMAIFVWGHIGKRLVSIAEPLKCYGTPGCQNHIILIDAAQKSNIELFSSESLITHPLYWSPDNNQLAFICFSPEINRGAQCISDLLVK